MGKFMILDRNTELEEVLVANNSYKSIIFWKVVQGGKTSDILKVVSHFYKESAIIFISDKNTALAGQTNGRAKVMGFEVVNYRDDINMGRFMKQSVGKKKILHLLMEVNNLQMLEDCLFMHDELPVTIVIDEADKSRNTIEAKDKKTKEDLFDDDEDEKADGSMLPPVTLLLLQIKNMVKERENSRTIFVSATPAAVLTAEKDNWLVLYKQPYQNYVGVGIEHPSNIHLSNVIEDNTCKARDRWTGNPLDIRFNTFYRAVSFGVDQFMKCANHSEEAITQVCLISLENRKIQQYKMSQVIEQHIKESIFDRSVSVVIMNSDTKESSETTLASLIFEEKSKGFKKVIIIAGFMASRGVSFTDFSDRENMFELVLQVHYTKKNFPLNSSLQACRIFGPARRTVSKPAMLCNHWMNQDMKVNFIESFRIIKELAESDRAILGNYNPQRPLTQPYNFRYLKQGWRPEEFVYPSSNPIDHLPIVP